jgi:hypothetical protein
MLSGPRLKLLITLLITPPNERVKPAGRRRRLVGAGEIVSILTQRRWLGLQLTR